MKLTTVDIPDGKWMRWGRDDVHVCCGCGLRHEVEMKVDKRGGIWMRWKRVKKDA